MPNYKISVRAKLDIDEIYEFSKGKFGKNQALNYLVGLKSYFEKLAKNPNIGRRRVAVKKDLLSYNYQSHVIFYRVLKTHIRIVRVIYGGRDLPKILE